MDQAIAGTNSLWRVRGEDSAGEGRLIRFADLAQAVADGVLGPSDEVRGPRDGRWMSIGDHPELEEHLPPAPLMKPRSYDDADMDMTPMIDVSFQLIIFFMITACFVVQKTLDMPAAAEETAAPRRYTLSELAENNVIVTVKTSGAITVDGTPVEPDGVLEAVRGAIRGRSNVEMVLDAEDAVEHQTVVQVLDAAAGAEIEKVHFLHRAAPSEDAKKPKPAGKSP